MGQSVESAGASRRTVLKAAAWTAPAVAVVAAAPLTAASPAGEIRFQLRYGADMYLSPDTITIGPELSQSGGDPEASRPLSLFHWSYDFVSEEGDDPGFAPIFTLADFRLTTTTFSLGPEGTTPIPSPFGTEPGQGDVPADWIEVEMAEPSQRQWLHTPGIGPAPVELTPSDSALPRYANDYPTGFYLPMPTFTYPRETLDPDLSIDLVGFQIELNLLFNNYADVPSRLVENFGSGDIYPIIMPTEWMIRTPRPA